MAELNFDTIRELISSKERKGDELVLASASQVCARERGLWHTHGIRHRDKKPFEFIAGRDAAIIPNGFKSRRQLNRGWDEEKREGGAMLHCLEFERCEFARPNKTTSDRN